MKKLVLLVCVLCTVTAVAQNKKRFLYYLNNNWESVPKEDATILGKGLVEKGLLKLDCYALTDNLLLMTAHFTDSSLSVLQGPFTSFHPNGDVAEAGVYKANNKEGVWQKWDSLGHKTDSAIYQMDNAMVKVKWGYTEKGTLRFRSISDSLADTYQSFGYDTAMNVTRKVEFKGQKGLMTTYDMEGIRTDSLFTRQEEEADFPGKTNAWRQYLEKNLNPNVPVYNKAPAGIYQVKVRFIVNKDGTIEDITPLTNHGYGMEKEVIRVLKKGPKWIPAVQYGRKVKAYRMQPVTFVVQEK
jgi:Gram-negative bacterial TonB protein C-terminal